jgi:hypothetical protein
VTLTETPRARKAHIWKREALEHYVEPFWCSERLFAVEPFVQEIWDPACGFGRIVESAKAAHHAAFGTDIVDRGFRHISRTEDFLTTEHRRPNIVTNPPFDIFKEFALKALQQTTGKVAMLWLVPRLNAARWLMDTPLARIWLLTPRPSMPPGHTITAGQKPGGGTQDFCWLIWEHAHTGAPQIDWLRRDA